MLILNWMKLWTLHFITNLILIYFYSVFSQDLIVKISFKIHSMRLNRIKKVEITPLYIYTILLKLCNEIKLKEERCQKWNAYFCLVKKIEKSSNVTVFIQETSQVYVR